MLAQKPITSDGGVGGGEADEKLAAAAESRDFVNRKNSVPGPARADAHRPGLSKAADSDGPRESAARSGLAVAGGADGATVNININNNNNNNNKNNNPNNNSNNNNKINKININNVNIINNNNIRLFHIPGPARAGPERPRGCRRRTRRNCE